MRRPAIGLAHDVRSAWRALRAAPGLTAAVLLIMALAMGATTAVFSVVDAVALRGLPFDERDRLVSLDATSAVHSAQEFLSLRRERDVFAGVAAIAGGSLELRRDGTHDPEILRVQRVSAEFFSVLRVQPARGRAFTADEEAEGRNRVGVISHDLWQGRFGGAADVLGKRLAAADGDIEIVGVMPARFAYPVGAVRPTDLWVPYVVPAAERTGGVISIYLTLIARLEDDVTMERAQARVSQIAAGIEKSGARSGAVEEMRLRGLHEAVTGYSRSWLLMLLGAVVCVLLVACANVANLLLVRATVRSRELGVRAALGATRWNLARMLLAESLLLALAGTTLGVLAAWWGLDLLRSLLPPHLPRLADVAVDTRVLGVSAAAAIVTGIAFGLAPAFHGTACVGRVLADSNQVNTVSARRQWLRAVFLTSEVALAVVLLVGAALFLSSFARLMQVNVGLDYRDVLMVDVRPKAASADAKGVSRVLDQVSAIPGVESAALATANVPFSLSFSSAPIWLPARDLPAFIQVGRVSPRYFAVLRIPLRTGRYFTEDDRDTNAMVAILNETAAKTLFPGENPLGQRVRLDSGECTIVGVVGDTRGAGPERDAMPQVFARIGAGGGARGTLLMRLSDDASQVLPQVRAAIWSAFPDYAIPAPRMLEESFGALVATRRFTMMLLSLFGLLGVIIAGTGIYAVTSYVVAQRTREIGIRMALGAVSSAILMSVLRRASLHVAVGLAAGLGLSWALARSVESFLFRVEPHDLGLYACVALALAVTALAGAILPARRAARVDPVLALRSE